MKGLLSLFLYCSYVTVLVAAIAITNPGVNRHIIMPKTKPKARTTKVRKSHSNDCVAFREYNQLKDMEDQNAVSALRLSQSNTNAQQSGESISSPSDSNYTCSNYNTCLEAHLHNLHQFGLKQRCAIAQSIPNMQDRKITFTHVRAEKTHTCTVLNSVILQTLGCDLIESCSLSLERLHY